MIKAKNENSGTAANRARLLRGISGAHCASVFKICVPLVLVAVVFLLAGCGGAKPLPEQDYFDVLSKWTRSVKVFDGLDAKIYMTATYKDNAFISAYVKRYVKAFKIDDSYAAVLYERELSEADRYNEFFISVYTPEDAWNDLARQNSIWRLYLEDGTGVRLAPLSISQVDKGDPLLREFFPYMDMWSTAYRIKFPKYSDTGSEPVPNASTKHLKLIVTGIMGEGTLEWRLKE